MWLKKEPGIVYTDILTMLHQCSWCWIFTCEISVIYYHSVRTHYTLRAHWRVTLLQYVLEIPERIKLKVTYIVLTSRAPP